MIKYFGIKNKKEFCPELFSFAKWTEDKTQGSCSIILLRAQPANKKCPSGFEERGPAMIYSVEILAISYLSKTIFKSHFTLCWRDPPYTIIFGRKYLLSPTRNFHNKMKDNTSNVQIYEFQENLFCPAVIWFHICVSSRQKQSPSH